MADYTTDHNGHDHSPDPSSEASGLIGTYADNGRPIWPAYQAASYIARASHSWANNETDLVVDYSFSDDTNIGAGFEVFDPASQDWARYVLDRYAEVSGMTFNEVGPIADADITFKFQENTTNGGGYWGGGGVVVGHVAWEPETTPGTYAMRLLMHEAGHAVGLSHPGPYNGGESTYADDAIHWGDSRQFTNLSYWSEEETGASFGHMSTLGLHDILATQIEYGINWDTRTGDDVYGWNATTGLESYDFSYRKDMAFSIWDGAGEDTLDFSGSLTATELDLRDGAFSSTNGQIYNVSIAYGAVIENGIGSDQDDIIIGNGTSNTLTGGSGDDVISGGESAAPVASADPRHFTGIEINAAPLTRDEYLAATDVDALSGEAFTFEMMVDLIRNPSYMIALASYAVPGNSNEFMIQGFNAGTISIYIDGIAYDTGIATATLLDGQPHRLSISWDSASGALETYIDGVSLDSGVHQQGITLGAGGTLIFGQEQDSVGGHFATSQILPGTVGDIRIFDTVQSAGHIAEHAFSAPDTADLAHHWQVATDGTITDSAGGKTLALTGGTVRDTAPIPDLTPDNDHLSGGFGNDRIDGGWGDDYLDGEAGNDTLKGGSGDDTLIGGAGQAAFNPTGTITLTDVFRDRMSVSQSSTYQNNDGVYGGQLILDNDNGTYNHTYGVNAWVELDMGGTYSVESIVLVNRDSWGARLNGAVVTVLDSAGAVLQTFDPVAGAFNGQVITYTPDMPLLAAAIRIDNADDFLHLGELDVIGSLSDAASYDGTNRLYGERGDDSLLGGAGHDVLDGGADADVLDGREGDDTLFGRSGDDIIEGREGDDVISGGTGDDHIAGDIGDDLLRGDAGFDWITGDAGADRLRGGTGDDTLMGGHDSDDLRGQGGTDRILGQSGDDMLFGGGGDDMLNGGSGNDTLLGQQGQDFLHGSLGNDSLSGGTGEDYINGGDGDDILTGGADTDRFVFKDNHGADQITDFRHGTDRLELDDALLAGSLDAAGVVSAYASEIAGGIRFDFGNGNSIDLTGGDLTMITDDIVIF